jgi:GNAT superfamily N-acetyltransferase
MSADGMDVTLKDRTVARIRPILPEDSESLLSMFNTLSRDTLYNRFFKLRRPFTVEEVQRMCKLDPAQEIGIAAVVELQAKPELVADARYYVEDGKGEVAIVVHDRWQQKGLGTAMMRYLIEVVRQRGLKQLYMYTLTNNSIMIHVGKKVGFTVNLHEYGVTKLEMNL